MSIEEIRDAIIRYVMVLTSRSVAGDYFIRSMLDRYEEAIVARLAEAKVPPK